jgi:cytochrome oxidase Cu insertion factor (SCO1/SenC/PrrC family)
MRTIFIGALLIFAGLSVSSCFAQNNDPARDTTPTAARSKTDPIQTGEIAPDFSLADQDGKVVSLSAAGKPVILVFYRGYW